MTTSAAIRPAEPADLAALPAIETAADELFAAAGIGPLPAVAGEADYAAARIVLVSGRPAYGFARIDEVDGQAHLEQLSVHPDQARRGVGSALIVAACTWAAGQRYDAVTLCTFAAVPWNAPLYARHGFEPIDELGPGLRELRATEARLGLDALGPRVVMRRRLDAPVIST